MINLGLLPLFIAGAFALAIAPGPDMAFTLATTASKGWRAGLMAVAGINLGAASWTLATVLGLSAMLAATEHALTVVRWVGGAYLVWLAIQTLRKLDALPEGKAAKGMWPAFRRGFLTNLLNPKVGLFYMAFLPQFTNAEIGPVWMQMLILAGIFFVIGDLVLLTVVVAAGAARSRLERSAAWRRALNALAATAFGGLGLRLLIARDAG